MAEIPNVQTLDDALHWLDRVEAARSVNTTGTWPLGAVLDHLAQSVEMSMDGFPQMRSPLFRSTAGSAAFAFFRWRGTMSHGLAEAIPGAPALNASADWKPGALRLREAIRRFNGYNGTLRPHFAYGQLTKNEFAMAHHMHIVNHQDEIVLA